ncbi:MAG: L-lactate transport [Planctomycetota bacterium]|nr:L-lactate transport [Planctomycetota bacterium]
MWMQNYNPMNNWVLSTAVAAVPIVVLLGLLISEKVGAWQSALAGLLAAMGLAVFVFGMPANMVMAAAGFGVVFATFRILWLIVAAVFLYDIAVKTGQFDVMKRSIAQLSGDRRLQAVLVAFSFGAFIEGAAGFGAPVAISAAFLVGLGFRPFQAAVLCLIANTAPVAWGSIGTPIRTLATVTSLDVEALSATSGRILPFMSLIIPFWLVRTMVSWRETFAVWPALLTMGGTFAVVQFAWSNYVSYELVDLVSAVASLLAGAALLAVWRPKTEWRFPEDAERDAAGPDGSHAALTTATVAKAWMPFVILSMLVLIWGLPPVKSRLERATIVAIATVTGRPSEPAKTVKPPLHTLHLKIAKGAAITGHETPTDKDLEKAEMDLVPLTSTGTAVFFAAVLSGLLLGLNPVQMARIISGTLRRLVPAMAAILAMLALGFVTKYSGMDAVLGLAFTRTGSTLYPIFGTLLGWLGVALTGSDTSSNVLFGNLQTITARKLELSPILMASANTTGGVMGKMIDAQSIVVAAAATGEGGREGDILRAVIWHSLALALMVGGIVWLYAHVFPGMVVTR